MASDHKSLLRQSHLFRLTLLLIFFVEILSFFGYLFPEFNTVAFAVITVLVFILSLKKLEWGWFVLVAELMIGSKGHLFGVMVFGFPFSIRLALFLAVVAACIVDIFRTRSLKLKLTSLWKPFLGVVGGVLLGTVVGLLYGNDLRTMFLDVNGYLSIGIILIAAQVVQEPSFLRRLWEVSLAAMIASMAKAFLALFFFSHHLPYVLPFLYRWIRVTGVGEITAMSSGFYRIFFQSHLFIIFAGLITLAILGIRRKTGWGRRSNLPLTSFVILSFSVILLSYSRSFWLGAIAGLALLGWMFRRFERRSIAQLAKGTGVMIGLILLGALLVLFIVKFPYPRPARLLISDLISERTEDVSDEVGGASRLALLGPLTRQALKNPLTGTGFGTIVTYQTKDPRALLANPDGRYSTYAFEWGYLGFMVKFGLLGLTAMLWFCVAITRLGFRALRQPLQPEQRGLVIGLLVSIGVLLVVHATTPYLDHPIGIGFLAIAFASFRALHLSSQA